MVGLRSAVTLLFLLSCGICPDVPMDPGIRDFSSCGHEGSGHGHNNGTGSFGGGGMMNSAHLSPARNFQYGQIQALVFPWETDDLYDRSEQAAMRFDVALRNMHPEACNHDGLEGTNEPARVTEMPQMNPKDIVESCLQSRWSLFCGFDLEHNRTHKCVIRGSLMLSLNPVAGVDVDQMKKIWAITSQYDYKFVRLGLVSFLAHFEQTMENLQVAKNWQSRLLPTIGVGALFNHGPVLSLIAFSFAGGMVYCATIYVLDKMIDFGPLYDSFLARKLRRFHLQILAISGIIGIRLFIELGKGFDNAALSDKAFEIWSLTLACCDVSHEKSCQSLVLVAIDLCQYLIPMAVLWVNLRSDLVFGFAFSTPLVKTCQLFYSFSASFRSAFRKFLLRMKKCVHLNSSTSLMLWSPLLFAPTARGLASDHPEGLHGYYPWMEALGNTQQNMTFIWTHSLLPSYPVQEQSLSPTALLLATLISTSAVVLFAQVGKNDNYQAHIIGFCALIAAAAAAVRGVELIDFIFAYLLWGCVAGVGGSWIVHRVWTTLKNRTKIF